MQVLYSKLIINNLTIAFIGLNRSLFWLRRLGCVGLRTTVPAKTMARTLHGVYEKIMILRVKNRGGTLHGVEHYSSIYGIYLFIFFFNYKLCEELKE